MRTADKIGTIASAWEFKADRTRPDWKTDWDASLGLYFIHGPFHPLWSWWALALVHLRDLPGMTPANRHYPEAEYEFAIWSLDSPPAGPPFDPDSHRWAKRTLSPADVVKHFHVSESKPVEERDRIARHVLDQAVDAIIFGMASPDSDYRSWWDRAIDNTIEHALMGGHPPEARA